VDINDRGSVLLRIGRDGDASHDFRFLRATLSQVPSGRASGGGGDVADSPLAAVRQFHVSVKFGRGPNAARPGGYYLWDGTLVIA
jgi:hypothetical protein